MKDTKLREGLIEVLTGLANKTQGHDKHMIAAMVGSHTAIIESLFEDYIKEVMPEKESGYIKEPYASNYFKGWNDYRSELLKRLKG